jgi:hypothetical protein
MKTWRMSLRDGIQGCKMWPACFDLHVAAITYLPLEKTDLSKYPEREPKELWAQLKPAQKASLRRVAYEMKPGDVIYVKEGPEIVGKGVVEGEKERAYKFDSIGRLKTPSGLLWSHQVPVKWVPEFPPVKIFLGSEMLTVKELSSDKLTLLEEAIEKVTQANKQTEALEGETYSAEAVFRRRNRALIEAKKANSDYRCEVCKFNFEETYGVLGRAYIIAHHLKMIASGPSKTTLDDIALVCANCHAMIHAKNPPISIEDMRKRVGALARPDCQNGGV